MWNCANCLEASWPATCQSQIKSATDEGEVVGSKWGNVGSQDTFKRTFFPPGWSSTKFVTSYTLSLTIIQASVGEECFDTSAAVYDGILVGGNVVGDEESQFRRDKLLLPSKPGPIFTCQVPKYVNMHVSENHDFLCESVTSMTPKSIHTPNPIYDLRSV